jgi:hypothetical protein
MNALYYVLSLYLCSVLLICVNRVVCYRILRNNACCLSFECL